MAKLARFNWWPGKVVSYKTARQNPPATGHCWLCWFGDHKVSQLDMSTVESLHTFNKRLLKNKLKGKASGCCSYFVEEQK